MSSTLVTRDGRVLSYQQFGDLGGRPVICLHGTPGCRVGPWPRTARLYPLGIRLIAYDRPGYGGSGRLPGRRVAHAAADVEDLADELGIGPFAVVGRSGGAPHALACAALLPKRVTQVAALVACAPRDLMGEQWYDGMSDRNVEWYRKAERGLDEYTEFVTEPMNRSREDLGSFMPYAHAGLPKADRATAADYGIRTRLWDNFTEALRPGNGGWIDDGIALVNPWGFDLSAVAVPALLWHGSEDIFSPVGHSRWLEEALPAVTLEIERNMAHLSAMKVFLRILCRISAGLGRSD